MIHRKLSAAEEIEYRDWARTVFKPGQEINPTWHPVVIEECEQMIEEETIVRRISDTCTDLVQRPEFSAVDLVVQRDRDNGIVTVKFFNVGYRG